MRKATRTQWIKFSIVTLLYLAFLVWVKSWLGLIVLPFIFDIYISKKIPWGFWKKSENPAVRSIMSWAGSRLLRKYLCVPELPDTVFLTGEILVGRRFPLCQQDELWPARTKYTAFHAVSTTYAAGVQH